MASAASPMRGMYAGIPNTAAALPAPASLTNERRERRGRLIGTSSERDGAGSLGAAAGESPVKTLVAGCPVAGRHLSCVGENGPPENHHTMSTVVDPGLEGVVVGETVLSNVEGEAGRLTYRGYDIHDLAEHANFEEVAHLLLYGHLPTLGELTDFNAALAAKRQLPSGLIAMMHAIPRDAWPMDVLRTATSGIGHFVPHRPDGSHETSVNTAIDLIAKFPTIVATWGRMRRGLDPIAPDPTLTTAANFLY